MNLVLVSAIVHIPVLVNALCSILPSSPSLNSHRDQALIYLVCKLEERVIIRWIGLWGSSCSVLTGGTRQEVSEYLIQRDFLLLTIEE